MHVFKCKQAETGETRQPVKEFFKAHLSGLPRKAKETAVENYCLVKNAFILRNNEGKPEVRATVKMPAAYVVANQVERLGVVLATALIATLTSWSNEAKTLVGGILGDYVGNSLGFGIAWYVFNAKRFSEPTFRAGAHQFFREWGQAFWTSFGGVATILDKRMKEKIAASEGMERSLLKIARPAAIAAGIAISPVAASYYLYSAAMLAYSMLGLPPVAAALVGGIGITAFFTFYTVKLYMPFLKKIDAGRETDSG